MRISTLPWPCALGLAAIITLGASGCAPSVVLENPVTKQRVDCTLEAERLAAFVPLNESTGTDVPQTQVMSPEMVRFDYEHQCRGNLEREGFVCVSGC
jgi:hypothetical protein